MYISGIEREMLRRKNKGRTKRKLLLTLKYQNSRYDQFVIFRTNCVIFSYYTYIYIYVFVRRSNVSIFYTNIVLYSP